MKNAKDGTIAQLADTSIYSQRLTFDGTELALDFLINQNSDQIDLAVIIVKPEQPFDMIFYDVTL